MTKGGNPLPFPVDIRPDQALRELVELNQKLVRGMDALGRIREEDITPGVTPKQELWRRDNVVLYRFTPVVEKPFSVPVLIVYALVNRPYMMDLQEDRSLIRKLLSLGMDIYLIDWGYPRPSDRWLTLDDYVNGYIDDCVEFIRDRTELEQINLLGVCQGGTLGLCYSALHPEKVKNLITMVTPVDFHAWEGLLNVWAQHVDPDLLVDALGNVPGEFLNFGFLMLKPFQLSLRKYVDLLDVLEDEDELLNFLRMEKWIFDSPDQAGEAYRQFARDFYLENRLIKGEVEIGGRLVDLDKVRMPVLNLYAEHDHLVPPSSSVALKDHVGTDDYTVRSFPVGHIGMYVSGKVQRDLPPAIAEWLTERE
ncbi:MAG TPA: class III poly(R)-hydroxyalkanoic acid synthase subunit PhaC [Actinomycetota bacterium]|nr:class III poly(R)-hydroxyalkanoic acid synthase subunit PhaC [Actinomycetota bacterium]